VEVEEELMLQKYSPIDEAPYDIRNTQVSGSSPNTYDDSRVDIAGSISTSIAPSAKTTAGIVPEHQVEHVVNKVLHEVGDAPLVS